MAKPAEAPEASWGRYPDPGREMPTEEGLPWPEVTHSRRPGAVSDGGLCLMGGCA